MWFEAIDNSLLVQLILFAVGLSYVVTGSVIGFPVRVIGWRLTSWFPIPLTTIFFCPSCCAWWMGAGVALWANVSWPSIIQIAFTACVIAAIIQSQFDLAADDRGKVEQIFKKDKANGKNERPE